MLLTIYNLPITTRYNDLKQMIQLKCGISEIILDNLINDGKGNKKVTVGVAEEGDAAILVRKINGIFIGGNQLYVENVKQNKSSEQPYHSLNAVRQFGNRMLDDIKKQLSYQQSMGNQDQNSMIMNYMTANNMGMYYNPVMPQVQTPFMNVSSKPQISSLMSQFPEVSVSQERSFGRDRSETKDRSRDSVSGFDDQNYNDRRRSDDNWQRSLYGDRRQPSPRRDQRNENFGRDQKAYGNFGGRPRRAQSNTVVSHSDKPWEQPNTSAPRTVRREQESRWESSFVADPRKDRNRLVSRWDEPNVSLYRDTKKKNEPKWEHPDIVIERDPVHMRSSRSPARPPTDLFDRYNPRSDLSRNDYEDRKAAQGNWDVDYSQQIPSNYPKSFNSNVFGVSGQSSMFGSHVTEPVRLPLESQKRNGPSRWDNSNRDNSGQLEIPQQRPSLSEKNRPVRVSRPSPRHDERDIFRPSKLGDRRPRALNKRVKDLRSFQEPKVKRLGQLYVRPKPATLRTSPYLPRSLCPLQKSNMTTLLHKDLTWRHQAASAITKETLKNIDTSQMGSQDQIGKKLKASIKSRIDVMLGERVAIPMEEIVDMYRQRFHTETDQAFFVAVLDSLKNGEENKVDIKKPDIKGEGTGEDNEASEQASTQGLNQSVVPDIQPVTGSARVPRYPNQELRQIRKQEMVDGNMYKLPQATQTAVEEQADILCDLFMEACDNPDNNDEEKICQKITDIVADDFRKVIRLQLTKRLLDVKSNLVVRIFATQKVNKQKLASFLAPFNPVSFKKSDRKVGLFIANCADYEGFDRLCSLKETVIDGVTITFKPMHITGPPPKIKKSTIISNRMMQQHDIIKEILLEKPEDSLNVNEENLLEKPEDSLNVNEENLLEKPEDSLNVNEGNLLDKPEDSLNVNEENLLEKPEDSLNVNEENLLEKPDDSLNVNEENFEHNDKEVPDDCDPDGDEIDNEQDDNDQNNEETEYNIGENVQDIPDIDDADEDDLEDY